MAKQNTVLMITNKANDTSGLVKVIDEENFIVEWDNEIKEEFTSEEFNALLENDEFELEEVELEEGTPAQDSISTHSSPDATAKGEADGNPKTRLDMIRAVIGGLADIDTESLVKMFNDQQAMIGGEGDRAGLGAVAAKNQASVAMKPSGASAAMESVIPTLQKAEQDAIFAESSLTDDAKVKMTALFESAVLARVTEEVVKLQVSYDAKLQENTESITTSLIESIDTFLNHAAEEWLKENEVAIESALRSELTSEFLDKLQELFTEHYIDVPEEKVNVIEKLVAENEELNNKLNAKLTEEIETQKTVKEMKKSLALASMSEGLTIVQKDKLKKLAESVDFEDDDKFKVKVTALKEGFLKDTSHDSNIIEEGIEKPEDNKALKSSDAKVSAMANALKNLKI